MASRFVLPFADVGSGISPSDGATLDFFDTGTSTRKDTFSNEALTLANANPVVANGDGVFPDIFMPDGGRYKVTLKDKNSVQIFEADPVVGEVSAALSSKTFDTVALMVASTELNIGDIVETAGYLSKGDGGDNRYEVVAAATGTADGGSFINLATHQAKGLFPNDIVNLNHFGADKVDDTTAITNALGFASGSTLDIPEGIFVNIVDLVTMFTPGANTTIRGAGPASIIRFNLSDTTTRTLFAISNAGVRFENLRIEINASVVGATIVGFQWGANNLSFDNVEIDGNVTGDIAASHLLQLIKCDNTGSFNDLSVTNCDWSNVTRFWLRDSAATSAILRLQFDNNRFEKSESSMFAINGVNGSVTDVIFSNNTFTDPFISAVQSDSFCIGPQATNVAVTGNTFRGTGQECLHLEEKVKNITITGNSILMNVLRGILVTDNNVSTSAITPERIVISSNIIKRTDEDGLTGTGIQLVNDGTPEPAERIIISDNVIMGWGTGITNASEQDDLATITDNIIDKCATGLSSTLGLPGFKDNLIANCTTGIATLDGGGTFGFTRFSNVTTKVNPTGGDAVLLGFQQIFARTTLTASGDTDKQLFPMGANERFYGFLSSQSYKSDTDEATLTAEITWDGSIFTNTTKITKTGGALTNSYVDVASILTLRVNNSGAELTDASIYCNFDGTYIIS